MTPLKRAFAGVLAVSIATGGAAAAIPAPSLSAPMTEPEARVILDAAMVATRANDCGKVLGLLTPALPRLTGRNRTTAQLLRVPCLASNGQGEEIAAVYRELAIADPRNPMVRGLGIVVALASGDSPEAARRLAGLAEEQPEALGRINGDLARGLFQSLTERQALAERDRLFLALARADWQPADRPELRDAIMQGGVEALLQQRRTDEAADLLSRITAPELLVSMAIEQAYAPLWPMIEARLGPHSAMAVDRFAAPRLAAYANRPDDPDTRRDAVRAFVLLGRLREAADAAGKIAISPTMREADVVAIRQGAQALASGGDRDAAITRLRALTTADVARVPGAAAAWIAIAELQDESRQGEAALATARAGQAQARDTLSPWGMGWLKRSEACALAMLGRKDEARQAGDALTAEAKRNPAATIEGLLCLGRSDEAASIAITALGTRDGADTLADQFQPAGALWAPIGSRLRSLWAPLLARPAVKAAFDKAARILPERLWPDRQPRPLPRVSRPDGLPVT